MTNRFWFIVWFFFLLFQPHKRNQIGELLCFRSWWPVGVIVSNQYTALYNLHDFFGLEYLLKSHYWFLQCMDSFCTDLSGALIVQWNTYAKQKVKQITKHSDLVDSWRMKKRERKRNVNIDHFFEKNTIKKSYMMRIETRWSMYVWACVCVWKEPKWWLSQKIL